MEKEIKYFKNITKAGFYLYAGSLPFTLVLPQFGIGLVVLGWLGEGVINKNWQVKWHPILYAVIVYLSWSLLGSLLSIRPIHSFVAWVDNEWLLLIMIFMYWSIESHEELIKVVYTFLSSSSLTILYGIWQVFFGFEYINKQSLTPFGSLFRAAGLHGFYLTFAAFAMIIFLLSVALFVEVKKKEKWLFLALAFLSFGAVVGTFARSIWLSFVAVIPSFGFLKSRKTGILVSVSFLILVLILVVIFPAIRERVTSFVDPSQSETRLNLWKTSLSVFADNPILGVGEDNFDYHFEHYKVEGFYDTIVHPHNDYLNILVQSGLPGLIVWLTIWGIALSSGMNAFRSLRDARVKAIAVGATLSLIGFLVGSIFQNYYGTFYNCLEWWFIVGMIMTTEKFKDS